MEEAYVALGSNLDSPEKHIRQAIIDLGNIAQTQVLKVSSLYRSPPMGDMVQPDFINAVVKLSTQLSPHALLSALLAIEQCHGRVRKERWGPRTLDCDLLLYGQHQIQSETLTIPHPGIEHRAFVLLPLAEIAPDLYLFEGYSMQNNQKIWQVLEDAALMMRKQPLSDLFAKDMQRPEKFSIRVDQLHLDYSKNFITSEILTMLLALADAKGLKLAIEQLFSGHPVNTTEGRPALHTAMRQAADKLLPVVQAQKEKMAEMVQRIQQGNMTDVVNLGIGGSDLGPLMAVEALKDYQQTSLKLHFVSNIDPNAIATLLAQLNPATTLFIISSKSFTTTETLTNAHVARVWLQTHLKEQNVDKHFIAVTANPEKAQAYGISPENILTFCDWVGGRYSIWSTIGLPLALSIGMQQFEAFLAGARAMDAHFSTAPFAENMPVLLALIGIWYINFWQASTLAILPYANQLRYLPDYLQQLDMESNGKSVQHSGQPVNYATGPIIWGQAGTNGQHAFYQLLHQGTHFIPIDFIVAKQSNTALREQHLQLVANCFAQAAALMQGRENVESAHSHMPGNKPSNMLLLEKITPYAFGQLLALYEHKVFVQGAIWKINSFDQPGVELGKQLANHVLKNLLSENIDNNIDPSTQTLIQKIKGFSYEGANT